jgi:ribose transport system ATP-binding protein
VGVVLELRSITKEYPGVTALKDVSIQFETGEVHAIMGENGAGKSTLIKTISGAISPNAGRIVIDGKEYSQMSPTLSKTLGIGVIYQEFNLIPELSVAENIFLGRRLTSGLTIDRKLMDKKAAEIIEEFGINLNVNQPVRLLTVAYQQLVEIAKSISNDVRVLIMDEPTAPLTNREIDAMFGIIEKLKQKGIAIIYISHRMDEVFKISDKISVMRDGEYIGTKLTSETDRAELISMMVGRSLDEQFPVTEKSIGDVVLELKNINTPALLKNISFNVRAGEILGLAGLVGAGRTETARAIYGADPYSGDIYIDGKKVNIEKPKDGIREGIALIPEDRKKHGALLELSIRENISFISIKDISKMSVVSKGKDKSLAQDYIDKLKIKTPGMEQLVKNLSGGNQQKVVLAKSLASRSKIMIFDEPTRGIDVGAKYEIYMLMNQLAKEGMAIIMISSEMPELLGMSDRIIVMHEGEIAGELSKEEATQTRILELASGNQ